MFAVCKTKKQEMVIWERQQAQYSMTFSFPLFQTFEDAVEQIQM